MQYGPLSDSSSSSPPSASSSSSSSAAFTEPSSAVAGLASFFLAAAAALLFLLPGPDLPPPRLGALTGFAVPFFLPLSEVAAGAGFNGGAPTGGGELAALLLLRPAGLISSSVWLPPNPVWERLPLLAGEEEFCLFSCWAGDKPERFEVGLWLSVSPSTPSNIVSTRSCLIETMFLSLESPGVATMKCEVV